MYLYTYACMYVVLIIFLYFPFGSLCEYQTNFLNAKLNPILISELVLYLLSNCSRQISYTRKDHVITSPWWTVFVNLLFQQRFREAHQILRWFSWVCYRLNSKIFFVSFHTLHVSRHYCNSYCNSVTAKMAPFAIWTVFLL